MASLRGRSPSAWLAFLNVCALAGSFGILASSVQRIQPRAISRLGSSHVEVLLTQSLCKEPKFTNEDWTVDLFLVHSTEQQQSHSFKGNLSADCMLVDFHVNLRPDVLIIGQYSVSVLIGQVSGPQAGMTSEMEMVSPQVIDVVDAVSIQMKEKQVDLLWWNQTAFIFVEAIHSSELPATVGLELTGPAEVVGNKTLLWSPGDPSLKNFSVRLTSLAGNESTSIVATARIVPLQNAEVVSNAGSITEIRLQRPVVIPKSPQIAVYRNSSVLSKGSSAVIDLDVTYKTIPTVEVGYMVWLIQATGCPAPSNCTAGISGMTQKGLLDLQMMNGTMMMRKASKAGSEWVSPAIVLDIDWGMIPHSAEVHVGVSLIQPASSYTVPAASGSSSRPNATQADAVVFVFGVAPDQCPPGTVMPGTRVPSANKRSPPGGAPNTTHAALQDVFLSLCCKDTARFQQQLYPVFDKTSTSANYTLLLPSGYLGGRSQLVVRKWNTEDVVLLAWNSCDGMTGSSDPAAKDMLTAGFQKMPGDASSNLVALDLGWLTQTCDIKLAVLSSKSMYLGSNASPYQGAIQPLSVDYGEVGFISMKLVPLVQPALLKMASLSYSGADSSAAYEEAVAMTLPVCGLPANLLALVTALEEQCSEEDENDGECNDGECGLNVEPVLDLMTQAIQGDTAALGRLVLRQLQASKAFQPMSEDQVLLWAVNAVSKGSFQFPMVQVQPTEEHQGTGAHGKGSYQATTWHLKMNPKYMPSCSADVLLFVNIGLIPASAVLVPELGEGALKSGIKVQIQQAVMVNHEVEDSSIFPPDAASKATRESSSLPVGVTEFPILISAPDTISSRTYSVMLYSEESQLKGVQEDLGTSSLRDGAYQGNGSETLPHVFRSLEEMLQAELFGMRPATWPKAPAQYCSICPSGTYAPFPDSSTCQLCPPGTYTMTAMSSNCSACPPGTFSFSWGASACRRCLAGTFSASNASTMCEVCPKGFISGVRGSSNCSIELGDPDSWPSVQESRNSSKAGSTAAMVMVVFEFKVILDISEETLVGLSPSTTGINGSSIAILQLMIQADTEDILGIVPTAVSVKNMQQVSINKYSVDVSASVLHRSLSASSLDGQKDDDYPDGSPGGDDGEEVESGDLSADDLVGKLTGSDAFPRTSRSTGGEVYATQVRHRVVDLNDDADGPSLQMILVPALWGSLGLAVALAVVWLKWRHRRGHRGCAPAIKMLECCCCAAPDTPVYSRYSNAGSPSFPARSHVSGGEMPLRPGALESAELELHPLPGGLFAARFRVNHNKSDFSLSSLIEPGAQDSAAPQDVPGVPR